MVHYWMSLLLGSVGAIGFAMPSVAQLNLTPDTAPGQSIGTQVTPWNARTDLITGGSRPLNGINVFHSFQDFNIREGQVVYFDAPAGVLNVFSRVTGSNSSEILGTLGTARQVGNQLRDSEANLFLMNPNGIVFGRNARLDVDRSFVATTANAIGFGDRGTFSVTNPTSNIALLTVNPSAYLFTQIPMGNIVNQSAVLNGLGLRVPNRQSLTLIGGNVLLEGGKLRAFGGRVEIGAVASPGRVEMLPSGALGFSAALMRGMVRLTDNAEIDVMLNNGGEIIITAGNINLTGGSSLLGGITTRGNAMSQAGEVQLDATGTIRLDEASLIQNAVSSGGTGNAGNVVISSGILEVLDGSRLSSSTQGVGNAGNVIINAYNNVLFQNSAIFSQVTPQGKGRGGNVIINVNAGSLQVRDGAKLIANTYGMGDAGNVVISVRDHVLLQGRETYTASSIDTISSSSGESMGTRQAGNVMITTKILEVRDGAQIIANTNSLGDAGNIIINVTNSALFQGTSTDGQNASAAISRVEKRGIGRGGNIVINVNTGTLEVLDGAQIAANTRGQGSAGNVMIYARDHVLFQGIDAAAFSNVAETGQGKGGNVEITTGNLEIRDGAQIVANTLGIGDAGNVVINVRDGILLDSTESINGRSSAILTSNGTPNFSQGTGIGGAIIVTTSKLQINNGATIDSSTVNDKPGGNITLTVGSLNLLGGGQIISTSDSSGSAGIVRLNATDNILISGSDPTYVDRLASNGTRVSPISPNSGLYVRASSTGAAGNLILTTPTLILDQQGRIDAQSATVSGGNIFLTVPELLLLRNGGQISATAGTANPQAPGNGGNIDINARFIVAIPKENSDITANATQGRGGNISINSQGIFGLKLQPKLTPFSDITASSEVGLTGNIILNAPDNSAIQNSLNQLPKDTIDTTKLLANTCIIRKDKPEGTFYITGTDGLPNRPGDRSPSQYPTNTITTTATRPWQKGDPIVEPQGFYQLVDGRLVMSRECQL